MAATIPAPESAGAGPAPGDPGAPWLRRFDGVERLVHWVNAALFAVLMVTGAALYLPGLDQLFGRRALVEDIHVWCGVALPVPVLLAVAGPWGRRLRADVRRWNRWTPGDRAWLRSAAAGRSLRPSANGSAGPGAALVGKFNAGQKLNAAWTAGAGMVLLGTGAIMRWYHPWPLAWRTGATFVHDWMALAVVVVVAGHIYMAARDPEALRSVFSGRISPSWARRHAPGWLEEDPGDP